MEIQQGLAPRTRRAAFVGVCALVAVSFADAGELGPARGIPGGPYEASGAARSPDGNGLLFVDDSRPDVIFWMRLGADGSPAAAPTPVPMGVSVPDPEGITADRTHVYVVGSQSRGRQDGGKGLVRLRFDGARHRAEGAEAIEDLEALLGERISAGSRGGRKSELNIEGLAWDARGGRLLLGLRAPLVDDRALVVPLKLRNPRGAFAASNIEVGTAIPVDLRGAGIRGLEADGAGGFWIIAGGVTEAGTSRLVRWDGSGSRVEEVATLPGELKPEGVTSARVGGKEVTVVFSDTSDYMVIPAHR